MAEKKILAEKLEALKSIKNKSISDEKELERLNAEANEQQSKFFLPTGKIDSKSFIKYHIDVHKSEIYSADEGYEEKIKQLPDVYGKYDTPPQRPVFEQKEPEKIKKTAKKYGVKDLPAPTPVEEKKYFLPKKEELVKFGLPCLIAGFLAPSVVSMLLGGGGLGLFILFPIVTVFGTILIASKKGENKKAYDESLKKYAECQEQYTKDQQKKQEYEAYCRAFDKYLSEEYPSLRAKYDEARNEFNLSMEKYVDQYNEWLDQWLPEFKKRQDNAVAEQAALISQQETKTAESKRNLEQTKDGFLADKYLDNIDELTEIINDGRADNLKEAISVFEDDVHKKVLQAAAVAQAAAEMERAQAERDRADAEYARAEQEAEWHRQSEQQAERDRRRAERDAKERDNAAKKAGHWQCRDCARLLQCNLQVYANNRGNCAAYRPK